METHSHEPIHTKPDEFGQDQEAQQSADQAAELERLKATYEVEVDGFVRLEDLAQGELTETAQYLVDFIEGENGKPALFSDLRFKGSANNFGRIRIHQDDMVAFLERYKAHKQRKIEEMMKSLDQS